MSTSIDILGGQPDWLGTKAPCVAATTSDLTGAMIGLLVVDGVQLVAGDRVLVRANTDETTNGVYPASLAAWTLAQDSSGTNAWLQGSLVYVAQGVQYGGALFVQECTDNPVIVGTSNITFSLFKQNEVTISQIRQGLATVDTATPPLVAGNIPSSPYNAITICWDGSVCAPGDALYLFIQSQLGYSSSQMAAFYATCASYPKTPA